MENDTNLYLNLPRRESAQPRESSDYVDTTDDLLVSAVQLAGEGQKVGMNRVEN